MDDLESLEILSLVQRVASELQNHLGISDKTLAEFVIAQHAECSSLEEFQKKLEAVLALYRFTRGEPSCLPSVIYQTARKLNQIVC